MDYPNQNLPVEEEWEKEIIEKYPCRGCLYCMNTKDLLIKWIKSLLLKSHQLSYEQGVIDHKMKLKYKRRRRNH